MKTLLFAGLTACILSTAAVAQSPFQMERVSNIESLPVWRLQLRVHTANESKAGTDSRVWVQVTDNASERFWLSRGGDDRIRNANEYYELLPTDSRGNSAVATVRDITQLTIGIEGDDRWKFDTVALVVNNPFVETGSTPEIPFEYLIYGRVGEPIEIARRTGHNQNWTVSGADLRRNRSWRLTEEMARYPFIPGHPSRNIGLQRVVFEKMIEASIGHEMRPGGSLGGRKWGKRQGRTYVGVLHKAKHEPNVARLDVDIKPSRLMDLEILFRLTRSGGIVNAELVNAKLRVSKVAKAFLPGLMHGLEAGLSKVVSKKVPKTIQFGGTPLAPRFTDNSDLLFYEIPGRRRSP